MTRQKWLPVAGGVHTVHSDAQAHARILRRELPECQVRLYQRGVRAGGYVFTVWCAVARKRPGEVV